ncbi:hypothetical protein [Nocardioides convexus]|uniref:hypothetical protein n=1 Tax=Nocardioides convexus TaxID=2712224 RepID=UPI0024184F05|nr:hypothetical protein [Nocardioides convexus]
MAQVHEATLSAPSAAEIAADPALAEAIRRANFDNLFAWASANVRAPGDRVPANTSAVQARRRPRPGPARSRRDRPRHLPHRAERGLAGVDADLLRAHPGRRRARGGAAGLGRLDLRLRRRHHRRGRAADGRRARRPDSRLAGRAARPGRPDPAGRTGLPRPGRGRARAPPRRPARRGRGVDRGGRVRA